MIRVWGLEAWQPGRGPDTVLLSTGQDLNRALGDLVLYNFSANTWERWDLSPAPVWPPPAGTCPLCQSQPGHPSCCSVPRSCLTLCDPMDCSTPGFPVLHYLPKFAQTDVH